MNSNDYYDNDNDDDDEDDNEKSSQPHERRVCIMINGVSRWTLWDDDDDDEDDDDEDDDEDNDGFLASTPMYRSRQFIVV
ncbi:hypothetical protein M0802_001458 [Mischocyttarus mexicanus]|nr:hypothetical protein M0802_001458 [Mischocyttarus mexicanus]